MAAALLLQHPVRRALCVLVYASRPTLRRPFQRAPCLSQVFAELDVLLSAPEKLLDASAAAAATARAAARVRAAGGTATPWAGAGGRYDPRKVGSQPPLPPPARDGGPRPCQVPARCACR
jgi:hypothetical protein